MARAQSGRCAGWALPEGLMAALPKKGDARGLPPPHAWDWHFCFDRARHWPRVFGNREPDAGHDELRALDEAALVVPADL